MICSVCNREITRVEEILCNNSYGLYYCHKHWKESWRNTIKSARKVLPKIGKALAEKMDNDFLTMIRKE